MKDIRAKKHLGQHFLNDSRVASNIINLIAKNTKNVVEIGPGMGMLTQFLIKKDYITKVVEIDPESILYLKLNYPDLDIYEGDFLRLNIAEKYPFNFSLIGKDVVQTEINALKKLKKYINRDFNKIVNSIIKCKGKVIFSGVGKSGLIAKKIASTNASLGIPSIYVDAGSCSHGDLGMISSGDVIIFALPDLLSDCTFCSTFE